MASDPTPSTDAYPICECPACEETRCPECGDVHEGDCEPAGAFFLKLTEAEQDDYIREALVFGGVPCLAPELAKETVNGN